MVFKEICKVYVTRSARVDAQDAMTCTGTTVRGSAASGVDGRCSCLASFRFSGDDWVD